MSGDVDMEVLQWRSFIYLTIISNGVGIGILLTTDMRSTAMGYGISGALGDFQRRLILSGLQIQIHQYKSRSELFLCYLNVRNLCSTTAEVQLRCFTQQMKHGKGSAAMFMKYDYFQIYIHINSGYQQSKRKRARKPSYARSK
jgi:hypothetical protein